jgi:hypothetical protein
MNTTYTVTQDRVVDNGLGIISRRIAEYPGLDERKAAKLAKNLAVENPHDAIYCEFFRAADGQAGYLNRGGHDFVGKKW